MHCLLRRLHDRSCLEIKLGVGHWDGLVVKPLSPKLTWAWFPRTHPVQRENWFPQVACDSCAWAPVCLHLLSSTQVNVVEQPIVSAQCSSGYVVYELRVTAVLPPPVNRAAFSLSWPSCCLLIVSMYYCFLLSPASLLSDLVPDLLWTCFSVF